MSKRHVGKTCVYCGTAPAATMDHIFAREFFPVEQRANLPKVPACSSCNGTKSQLEHYLTAVLPFGGMHQDALVALEQMVPPRLEKNAKLKNALSAGHRQELIDQNGAITPAMTIPFDSDRAAELFKFITQGLLYHHFGVLLDRQKHGVWAGFLNAQGEELHQKLLALNSRARVQANVGNGAFIYEGAQGTDIPEMSIWIFTLYGGIQTSGDPDEPNAVARFVGGVTASAGVLDRLSQFIKYGSAGQPPYFLIVNVQPCQSSWAHFRSILRESSKEMPTPFTQIAKNADSRLGQGHDSSLRAYHGDGPDND